jgi:hypothetical protein
LREIKQKSLPVSAVVTGYDFGWYDDELEGNCGGVNRDTVLEFAWRD